MQFGERDVGLGRNACTKGIIVRRQLWFRTAAGPARGHFAGLPPLRQYVICGACYCSVISRLSAKCR